MATSGSKSVYVTDWDTLKFSWTLKSQSVQYNYSTITWTLSLVSGSSGRIDSSAAKTWNVTISGTKYSGTTTVGISNNSTKTLASGSTTIYHAADGIGHVNTSFSQYFGITFSGSSIGTISGTLLSQLPTIPRASSLTAGNGTLGTAQTLTITRASDTFKHKITYTCGDVSGYAAGSSSTFTTATSVSWTPPLSLASENTTGTSVAVTLCLKTYDSSGTELGSTSKTITCTIPASVKPSCTMSVTDPTGYADTYGNPIKGLSKFKVTLTPTVAYNSAIASYSTTANGDKYTTKSFTTGVLKSAGSQTISAKVTDKRGRSATASTTKTVLDYTAPTISKLAVKRCDEDGSDNDRGEYVQVTFSGSATSLGDKNSATYALQYKKTSETEFTTVSLTGYQNNYTVTNGIHIFPADSGSSYNVVLTLTDNFGSTAKTTSVSTGFTLMHWLASGLGMAIGKIAELQGVLDISFKTKFTGGIQNEVLEKISDLNEVLTPNTYVSVNKGATSYTNCPIASGTFVLEVMSAGAEGQVFQRLTTTFKDGLQETYERHYFQSTWGAWSCVHSDTGWVNLELQSGISVGSECGRLRGRLLNDVLYIQGDVMGFTANWKYFAHIPASLLPSGISSSNRMAGLYDMSHVCGLNLMSNGQLYVSTNSTGAWDSTKNVSVNITLCGG